MGNGTLGNGTFQNVSGETGHFYYLGNGTFYSLGEETLYSLGNGTFYPLGTILSSGNRETYPLGFGPLILWASGHGKRDTYPLGIGNFGDEVQPMYIMYNFIHCPPQLCKSSCTIRFKVDYKNST